MEKIVEFNSPFDCDCVLAELTYYMPGHRVFMLDTKPVEFMTVSTSVKKCPVCHPLPKAPEKQFEYNKIKLTLTRYTDGSIGLAVMDNRDRMYKIYRLREDGNVEFKKPTIQRAPEPDYHAVDLVAELRGMLIGNESEWLKTHPDKPTWDPPKGENDGKV